MRKISVLFMLIIIPGVLVALLNLFVNNLPDFIITATILFQVVAVAYLLYYTLKVYQRRS